MINVICSKEKYRYNAYHMVKAFFQEAGTGDEVVVSVDEACGHAVSVIWTDESGADVHSVNISELEEKAEIEKALYKNLSKALDIKLPWGLLMGIRPAKLAGAKLEEGESEDRIINWFMTEKFASEEKAELAVKIASREKTVIDKVRTRAEGKGSYSLYVGIPFCPSVCSYCSFSSGPIEKWKDIVDSYIEMLIRELEATSKMMAGHSLSTVYIGGGTPTALDEKRLERLLESIGKIFSPEKTLEYTLEAGRPDSISAEKLEIIRRFGVSRISVNPQTMQQKTLDLIGRKHTSEDVIRAFRLAREAGFNNINMDIIAGLRGESVADMKDTLEKIKELDPDDLTVHCLSIKRAARESRQETEPSEIMKMLSAAGEAAAAMNMEPYYLYRQKSIAGNLENTGYAKAGKEGIYNIMIMEERESIIACGAGAQSKLVLDRMVESPVRGGGQLTNIIRLENMKRPDQYVQRIDEMIEEKLEMAERYL